MKWAGSAAGRSNDTPYVPGWVIDRETGISTRRTSEDHTIQHFPRRSELTLGCQRAQGSSDTSSALSFPAPRKVGSQNN